MTPAQLATLGAYIAAANDLKTFPSGSDAAFEIARLLNLTASPEFTVWQHNLTPDLARKAVVTGAMQLDNLTVGKRDTLLYLFQGTLDCTDSVLRTTLDDLCGTQNTLKAAILAATKRLATRFESVFATGTGSDASPATATLEGSVSYQDVQQARGG